MKISVSYLNVKYNDIPYVVNELDATSVDYIHVDVMDGKYVKGKANLYNDISGIGYYTRKRLDVHFMVSHPLKYIDDYASLNVFCMSFHLDIKDNIEEVIERCHMYGIKVGIALNPSDSVELIYPYLDKIDMILIMSVVPGLPGQKFMEEVVPKIDVLRKVLAKENRNILISVDGGINLENKDLLKNADILVSGSYVTNSSDYEKCIQELKK